LPAGDAADVPVDAEVERAVQRRDAQRLRAREARFLEQLHLAHVREAGTTPP
jgi:hypothetical protein